MEEEELHDCLTAHCSSEHEDTLKNHSRHHAGQVQVRIGGKSDLFRGIAQQGGLTTASLRVGGHHKETKSTRDQSPVTGTNGCRKQRDGACVRERLLEADFCFQGQLPPPS